MRKLLLFFPVIAALIYLPNCNNASAGGIELKFKLPKGSKYEYSMNMEMKVDRQMGGKGMDMKNDMGFTYLFEVINDSANWKTISSTISKVSMDMDAMGRTIHFDSDMATDTSSGPGAMFGKIFGAMKGANFSFTLNDKGEIGAVKGFKEMQDKMMENFPNRGGSQINPPSNSFDEESMKQNLQQAFQAYPGKPVKPGDTWTKTITQKIGGLLVKSENTFTLESVKGNDAVVKTDSKINFANGDDRMTMTGNGQGTTHYNLEYGIATDGDMEMKMDMRPVSDTMGSPMTMNMKMKIVGKKL